jgi:hypothetical protein
MYRASHGYGLLQAAVDGHGVGRTSGCVQRIDTSTNLGFSYRSGRELHDLKAVPVMKKSSIKQYLSRTWLNVRSMF